VLQTHGYRSKRLLLEITNGENEFPFSLSTLCLILRHGNLSGLSVLPVPTSVRGQAIATEMTTTTAGMSSRECGRHGIHSYRCSTEYEAQRVLSYSRSLLCGRYLPSAHLSLGLLCAATYQNHAITSHKQHLHIPLLNLGRISTLR